MATTGANTSAQWSTAAANATEAAFDADTKAFAQDMAVVEAKNQVKLLQDRMAASEALGIDSTPFKKSLQAKQDNLIKQTELAGAYRTQATTAGAAAASATELADKNSGPTPATTPPATTAPSELATTYTPAPPIQQVTSPSSALTTNYQANATVVTTTNTNITTVTQTSGGSSTTYYNSAPIDTPASKNLQEQSDMASKEAQLYSLNPRTAFGSKALYNKYLNGEITDYQYTKLKNSKDDERLDLAAAAYAKANKLSDQANKERITVPPEVVVTAEPTTTETKVEGAQTLTVANTKISGEIAGTGVTTETIDGTTYQVTQNPAQNTTTYTPSDNSTFGVTVPTTGIQNATAAQITAPEVQIGQAGLAPPLAAPAATTVPVAAPAAAPPVEKSTGTPYVFPDERGGAGGVSNDVPIAQRLVQDNDPEGTANIQEQNAAAANQAAIQNGQESVNLNPQGISTGKTEALNSGQDFKPVPDWRVRLSLAPGANYLYKVGPGAAGILNPLQKTEGVIFPYTPAISVAYAANYTPFDPTHSNYKIYQYTNSSVDAFSITCDFTAQDTTEANYLLAVIHFFKSITKMFYGKDQNPKPGTPPPLCYLSGLGEFQFDNHPLAITGFTYQLPIDVDYIRALPQPAISGAGQASTVSTQRGVTNDIYPIGPQFSSGASTGKPTYVPTKMQISITAHPIVSRNNISNKFSLKEYATGQLLLGKSRNSGGIW